MAVCKRLGVDYGMAMTGFDIRGGRSIPRFEGIVVCEEFAEEVEKEWDEEQQWVFWTLGLVVSQSIILMYKVLSIEQEKP